MVEKGNVSLVIVSVFVVVLALSSVWFYRQNVNLHDHIAVLETEKEDLQSQVSHLETEKTSLDTQVNTLQNEVRRLEGETDQLDNQVAALQTQLSTLQNDVDSLIDDYDQYIATHQYSDAEYDTVQFTFYYVKPEQKFDVYRLNSELSGLMWKETYEEGVFDCSEMSAYLERYLENQGWHTVIVRGDSPFSSGYHAWLLVETSDGKYLPVESTAIRIVWWSDPNFDNYWEYDALYETIHDALDYREDQYDWWNTYLYSLLD